MAMGTVDLSGGVHMGAGGGVPMASVLLPPPAQQAPMNPLVHMHAGMPVTMQHMVSAAGQVRVLLSHTHHCMTVAMALLYWAQATLQCLSRDPLPYCMNLHGFLYWAQATLQCLSRDDQGLAGVRTTAGCQRLCLVEMHLANG